jgi:DNA invertase Pin-like site-specific DNA recombinase
MESKAFAYLRVSGKGQVDGDGFPRQRAAIKGYAEAHGVRVVRWFEERGVSGTKNLQHRPALQELMVALHGDGTKTVLVEKLDRLARDLMVQETILADLKRAGFELISVSEPDLCSSDPTRILMRQMMGAFSQYEKSTIVFKLRAARQRKRKEAGRCEGRKPYGSRSGEAEVIERMLTHHRDGAGYDGIAKKLNAEGHRQRNGKEWLVNSVRRIVLRSA